jgi:divalent metal cation (Fe/Co/Zn/Cd) transporter
VGLRRQPFSTIRVTVTGNTGGGQTAGLERRGLRLEYATVGWNSIEAVVALASGIAAHSPALVAFGLDSAIEIFSAVVTIWQLRGVGEDRERRATRLIALSLFALALYVAVEAVWDLARHARPESSAPGMAIAAAALVVMPVLALAKRQVGRALANSTLLADSVETALCAAFSATALIGVGLNAAFGWRWADPVAALVLAALAAREGREAWAGEVDGDEQDAKK